MIVGSMLDASRLPGSLKWLLKYRRELSVRVNSYPVPDSLLTFTIRLHVLARGLMCLCKPVESLCMEGKDYRRSFPLEPEDLLLPSLLALV
jgi:hypothetical protein